MVTWLTLVAIFPWAILLAGCSAKQGPTTSGFLGDYSQLRSGPKDGPILVYSSGPDALAPYKRFIIDPVLVYFHAEAEGVAVDPTELAELTDYFHEQIVSELTEGGYEVVDAPGDGVARIRVALTDVDPASPGKNIGAKAGGIATGVGILVPALDVGRAAIEVELVDTRTSERIVAAVDQDRGKRFFNFKGSSTRWGDAKGAFRDWAGQFVKRLQDLHR
ncbi:hypothetical protein ABI59_12580 [Acidobacteria bacterium Mor1]|nr:hypothetical protein ABI59_12580 [Acidobacteria bacterium Mor1]